MSPGEFAGGDGLVDIHCHALPGVDDGAASVAMGLDMLRRAADEGVDDVVLTPHYRPEDGPDRTGRSSCRIISRGSPSTSPTPVSA